MPDCRFLFSLPILLLAVPAFAQGSIVKSDKANFRVETFATGLENPWSLAFLPDGRMLVTERPGRLRILDKDGKLSPPVEGVPAVAAVGQGGLLDIVLAIEGPQPAFRCTEIRQRGPCAAPPSACRKACPIARAFLAAETAWRQSLAEVTMADMNAAAAAESFDEKRRRQFRDWLAAAMQ